MAQKITKIDLTSIKDVNSDSLISDGELQIGIAGDSTLLSFYNSTPRALWSDNGVVSLVVPDGFTDVTGTDYADKITANNGGDTIHGGTGNDWLIGGNA